MLVWGSAPAAFAQAVPGAFLLYPNYRGLIFDDRPEILVEAPSGATVTVSDKVSGATVATSTSSGQPVKIASSTLTPKHPYTVTVAQGGTTLGTWDVMPVPASDRASMNVSHDKNGRLLMQNKPRFGLGVYDSGLSYFTDPASYESTLFAPGGKRQLGGINLNLYLNYHYGEAPLQAMQALMDALQNHDMMYLQTANCFASGSYTRIPFSADQGSWATDFAKHKGAAGFYIMDECEEPLVPETKQHHQALAAKAPGTMTFAATLAGPKPEHDIRKWTQTQDMLGTDPYPLFGAEPTQGYSHFQVADYVAYARSAARDSRPIFSVLQFFKFTSDSRWPTAAEQRAHAIMSIVEGADGLFWWEIGQNGLQKDPSQFATQMAILKANVNELAALESVLVAPDAPTALPGNTTQYADEKAGRIAQLNLSKTNSWLWNAKTMYQREIDRINAGDLSHSPMLPGAADVRTKVKVVGGKGYVFAYNYTNKTLPVTFTWHTGPGTVTENKSGTSYPVSGSSWSDSFGAYESRIYVISNGGTPPGGGGDEPPPPPPPTDPTVTFTNPADAATVTGTTTVTMTAAGGSGSGYGYKLDVDGANVYTGANGTFSWNTTTVANGAKTLIATVTDSNGKTGTASISVTVSNVIPAPTVTFTAPANGATVSGTTTVTMAGSGGSGSGYSYKLAIDGTEVHSGTSASYSWNTTTTANGAKTLTAAVTDSNGKTGTASISVTVSNTTTASFAVSFSNPTTDGVTVSGNLSVGLSTTAPWGQSKTWKLSAGDKVLTTVTNTGTVLWYTLDTRTLPDGLNTLKAEVAYNGETASANRTINVANGATTPPPPPASPTVSFTSPANGATVSGATTVTLAASGGSGSGYGYKLAVDGTSVYSGTSPSFSWNTTTAANGTKTLTATVTDSAGGTGTASVAVTVSNTVTAPPASFTVSFTNPTTDGMTVSGNLSVGLGTTAPWGQSKTWKLSVGDKVLTTVTNTGTVLWYTLNTTTLADGLQTLKAEVTYDGATASATRTINVTNGTTTPPPPATLTAAISSPAEGATVSGTQTVSMTSSGGASGSRTFKLEQVVGGTTTLLSTQTVSGTSASYGWNTTSVANGAVTLRLTVTDSAGASTSVTRSVTVSNTVTPPADFTATVTSPAEGATVATRFSIGTSTTAPWGKSKTFTVLVDGKVVGTKTTTGTVFWVSATVARGKHTIVVKVTYNGQTATSPTRTITSR
ncbi:MAG: Ig-like domain-containing protein [Candidatus Rokubacteria bacterium]|nr:Ig-like domain-containing protein [Candidatus Rokubacteria bacterium]